VKFKVRERKEQTKTRAKLSTIENKKLIKNINQTKAGCLKRSIQLRNLP